MQGSMVGGNRKKAARHELHTHLGFKKLLLGFSKVICPLIFAESSAQAQKAHASDADL